MITLGPLIQDLEELKHKAFWIGGTITKNDHKLKELIERLDQFEEQYRMIQEGIKELSEVAKHVDN